MPASDELNFAKADWLVEIFFGVCIEAWRLAALRAKASASSYCVASAK
jgi:hypothetical protein